MGTGDTPNSLTWEKMNTMKKTKPDNSSLKSATAPAALILTSAIGVAAGSLISEVISPRMISLIAGTGFMVIGAWTLYQGIQGV